MILGYLPNGLPAYAIEPTVACVHRLRFRRLSRVKADSDECGAAPLQLSRRRTIVYPLGCTRDRRTNGMDHIFRRICRVYRRRVSFRKHLDGANDCGRSNLSVVSTAHSVGHAENADSGKFSKRGLVVLALASNIRKRSMAKVSEMTHIQP